MKPRSYMVSIALSPRQQVTTQRKLQDTLKARLSPKLPEKLPQFMPSPPFLLPQRKFVAGKFQPQSKGHKRIGNRSNLDHTCTLVALADTTLEFDFIASLVI